MATTASKVLLKDKDGKQLLPKTKAELVDGLPDLLDKKQDKLTFDDAPTADSSNPVTSKGIKTAIENATKDIASSETVSDINTRLKTAEDKLKGIDDSADVNQNAFSNVKSGTTTIAAGATTDTLEVAAGDGVTVTPDATNKKLTIASTAASDIKSKLKASYDSTTKKITLSYDGAALSEIDASDFIKDGMVNGVTYDSTKKAITITFNTDAGKDDITVDVSDLVDTYTNGDGLALASNKFSVKVKDGEAYIAADSTGLHTTEALSTALSNKVDKETGKGLSTNDYTTDEKTKLSGIEKGAQANVLEGVQVNGTDLEITNKKVNVDLSEYAKSADVEPLVAFIDASSHNGTRIDKTYAEVLAAYQAGRPVVFDDNDAIYGYQAHYGILYYQPSTSDNTRFGLEGIGGFIIGGLCNVGTPAFLYRTFTSDGLSHPAIIKIQPELTFDSTPTENSSHPVTSGGVYTALAGKQDTLTIDSALSSDSTNPVQNKAVKEALDKKQDTISDLETIRNNASAGAALSSSVKTNTEAIETLQASGVFYVDEGSTTPLTEETTTTA